MIALLFKLPRSTLHGVFIPGESSEGVEAAEEQARLALFNGAVFTAVVTGSGRAVERIRRGGLHGIGELESYAEPEGG